MSIENTLERIADSLERLVDLQVGRNLILEAGTAAEGADATIEKPATRGRGRPRKNAEEPQTGEAAAPAKAEDPKAEASPQPEPEPAKEASKAAAPTSAPANVPTVEQLQLRAPKLAQKFGKEAVTGLIKKINPAAGNISGMDDGQRVAFWAALDALEAGATTDAEFG